MLDLIIAIAIVIAGECGPIGNGCEIEIAKTMANRLVSGEFGDTAEEVLEDYYGVGEVTPDAIRAAIIFVSMPEELSDGKYYFAYSNSDRYNMGWRKGDETICGSGLCVNFSCDWPG